MIPLHPICEFLPLMSEEEFASLKADIEAEGLIEPIILYEGKILDGRHRARACDELGIEPRYEEYEGNNPLGHVFSRNVTRRHLTPSQRAAVVALFTDYESARKAGGDSANLPNGVSTAPERAAVAGVSDRTQRMADKVAKASPELAKEVAAGKLALHKAVERIDPKPTKPAEPRAEAPADDSPFSMHDIVADLEEARKRNLELEALHAAIQGDDPRAEILKLSRLVAHARSEQDIAQQKVLQANKARDFYLSQLRRCGKAVDEKDLDKVAPAVEAFVRGHKVAA